VAKEVLCSMRGQTFRLFSSTLTIAFQTVHCASVHLPTLSDYPSPDFAIYSPRAPVYPFGGTFFGGVLVALQWR